MKYTYEIEEHDENDDNHELDDSLACQILEREKEQEREREARERVRVCVCKFAQNV